MKAPDTFLWHDYETFGANPMADRPVQFAAQRTDALLNPVDDPVVIYCRPSDDVLPHPMACLITGITPQEAREKGIPESDFAAKIHAEMMQPGTHGSTFGLGPCLVTDWLRLLVIRGCGGTPR